MFLGLLPSDKFHSGEGDASDEEPSDGDRPRGPTGTPPDASTLLVKLFVLGTISMVFGATLVGYAITRYQVEEWNGYKIEGLKLGLLISTATLGLCSLFLHRAVKKARAGRPDVAKNVFIAALFAIAFLANQTSTWVELIQYHGGIMKQRDISLFMFYILTWIHALHVLGGIVPFGFVIVNARRGRYGPGRTRGLENCALYWHYIDAVWVLIAIALWIG